MDNKNSPSKGGELSKLTHNQSSFFSHMCTDVIDNVTLPFLSLKCLLMLLISLAKNSDKTGQISVKHIFDQIRKNAVPFDVKISTIKYLARDCFIQHSPIQYNMIEKIVSDWRNKLLFPKSSERNESHQYINTLVVAQLTSKQINDCYELAMAKVCVYWEALPGYRALQLLLPHISLEKKEKFVNFLAENLERFERFNNDNSYQDYRSCQSVILEIVDANIDFLSNSAIKAWAFKAIINTARWECATFQDDDYYLDTKNIKCDVNGVMYGNLTDGDPIRGEFLIESLTDYENELPVKKIGLLPFFVYKYDNERDSTRGNVHFNPTLFFQRLLPYISEENLYTMWENIVGQLGEVHNAMKTEDSNPRGKIYKNLLSVLSVLALKISDERVLITLNQFIDIYVHTPIVVGISLNYLQEFTHSLASNFFQYRDQMAPFLENFLSHILECRGVRYWYDSVLKDMRILVKPNALQTKRLHECFNENEDEIILNDLTFFSIEEFVYLSQERRLHIFTHSVDTLRVTSRYGNKERIISCLGNYLPYMNAVDVHHSNVIPLLFSLVTFDARNRPLMPVTQEVLSIFPILMPFISQKETLDSLKKVYSDICSAFSLCTNTYKKHDARICIIALASIFEFHHKHFSCDERLLKGLFACASTMPEALNLLCQLVIQNDPHIHCYLAAHPQCAHDETLHALLDLVAKQYNAVTAVSFHMIKNH